VTRSRLASLLRGKYSTEKMQFPCPGCLRKNRNFTTTVVIIDMNQTDDWRLRVFPDAYPLR
jgi:hypothetical protein